MRNRHAPSAIKAPLGKSYCCKNTSSQEAVATTNYLSLTVGKNVEDGQTRAARRASSICPAAFEPSSLFCPLGSLSYNSRLLSQYHTHCIHSSVLSVILRILFLLFHCLCQLPESREGLPAPCESSSCSSALSSQTATVVSLHDFRHGEDKKMPIRYRNKDPRASCPRGMFIM